MSSFLILLGGELSVTRRLMGQIDGARVIAADSGIAHAAPLSVMPELWVGDFDSASIDLQRRYNNVEQMRWPADKAATDGEIAIDAALARGASEIILAGAFGGDRADHGFMILSCACVRRIGVERMMLTSGTQEAVALVPGQTISPNYPPGTVFSILAFSDLIGLTVSGAKWPIEAHDVAFGSSLVISNVVTGRLKVRHERGIGLLYARFAGAG